MSDFKPVIGLEVHIELKTKSKMFCQCKASYFGQQPNTQCCPVCLGLPGALPVPNKKAIEDVILIGLAFNCQINKEASFDRKNYFYPDLAKGYQISQLYQPFCVNGFLEIIVNGVKKKIRIREIHLEEDTGKLLHGMDSTLIDFNRSGVPLVEIVTEPDLETSEEVKEYLKRVQQIVRYLDASDCDMEKGSMRCEPSISIKIKDQKSKIKNQDDELPNYRVEVKNINSFRFAQKAVDFEIDRQSKLIENDEKISQETRGWSEAKNATFSQREKEVAKDYRYFTEPDIPPFKFSGEDIEAINRKLPELPSNKITRFMNNFQLSDYDAKQLTEDIDIAKYFEASVSEAKNLKFDEKKVAKEIANLIINKRIDIAKTSPKNLVQSIVNNKARKIISDQDLIEIIKKIIKENTKVVEDYKKGKEQAIMFLVGLVMREVKGQAEAENVHKFIKDLING